VEDLASVMTDDNNGISPSAYAPLKRITKTVPMNFRVDIVSFAGKIRNVNRVSKQALTVPLKLCVDFRDLKISNSPGHHTNGASETTAIEVLTRRE
jgi:hypothetical protein